MIVVFPKGLAAVILCALFESEELQELFFAVKTLLTYSTRSCSDIQSKMSVCTNRVLSWQYQLQHYLKSFSSDIHRFLPLKCEYLKNSLGCTVAIEDRTGYFALRTAAPFDPDIPWQISFPSLPYSSKVNSVPFFKARNLFLSCAFLLFGLSTARSFTFYNASRRVVWETRSYERRYHVLQSATEGAATSSSWTRCLKYATSRGN